MPRRPAGNNLGSADFINGSVTLFALPGIALSHFSQF
jgi:hypothetical protein